MFGFEGDVSGIVYVGGVNDSFQRSLNIFFSPYSLRTLESYRLFKEHFFATGFFDNLPCNPMGSLPSGKSKGVRDELVLYDTGKITPEIKI